MFTHIEMNLQSHGLEWLIFFVTTIDHGRYVCVCINLYKGLNIRLLVTVYIYIYACVSTCLQVLFLKCLV